MKRILVLATLCVLLAGCATVPWKRQAVTAYDGFASSMEVVQTNALMFYQAGTITKEQYDKIAVIYKPAKKLAVEAKEILDLAIDTEDALQQKTYMDKYAELLSRFKTLFYNLLDLALEFGVLSKPEYAVYKTM